MILNQNLYLLHFAVHYLSIDTRVEDNDEKTTIFLEIAVVIVFSPFYSFLFVFIVFSLWGMIIFLSLIGRFLKRLFL